MWLEGRRLLPMVVRMHGFTAGIDSVWKDHVSATRRLKLNWERKEFKAADVITVVSEHLAPAVRARFGTDRVQVVHNSIDLDHWRKLSVEAPQGVDRTTSYSWAVWWEEGHFHTPAGRQAHAGERVARAACPRGADECRV